MAARRPAQGLDLAAHYDDVRRLVCAHPSFAAAVDEGMEADDLLQEVLCRLAARQRMASRWDPSRAGLGGYVWLFTRTCVSQLLRAHRARVAEVAMLAEQGGEEDGRDGWGQLMRAANELGLDAEDLELLKRVVDGQLRRDAAEVVELAGRVWELVYGDG